MSRNHHHHSAAPPKLPLYTVNRPVLLQPSTTATTSPPTIWRLLLAQLPRRAWWSSLPGQLVPILRWLPRYQWRLALGADICAGLAVAVMHIPQGMAYSLLAGCQPSTGLYMAVYPTLVYFALGTSRHISTGSMSVVSIMSLRLIEKYASSNELQKSEEPAATAHYSPEQVATALAAVCGLQMLGMWLAQLGALAALLNEPLVSSFTMATAVHVICMLLNDMLGLRIPQRHGYFVVVTTVWEVAAALPQANWMALLIGVLVMAAMVLATRYVRPLVLRLTTVQLPVELLAICGGTVASYAFDLGGRWGVSVVGVIPVGLPEAKWPERRLMVAMWLEALPVTVVSYSLSISMGLLFARKHGYELRANQELLAFGVSNLVGSLVGCLPEAGSVSRSLVQDAAGGRTQVASVVSAALVCSVLMWMGPMFELLPRCVLSAVILMAIHNMYLQVYMLPIFHRESWLHSLTWVVTFVTVVFVDIVIGLAAGVAVSAFSVYLNSWRSSHCLLGRLPATGNCYASLDDPHSAAQAVADVHIFRYIGPINFVRCALFKRDLRQSFDWPALASAEEMDAKLVANHCLVLDLSAVTHLDCEGGKMLRSLQLDLRGLRVQLLLAAPSDAVYAMLQHVERIMAAGGGGGGGGAGGGEDAGEEFAFVVCPTLHDTVLLAESLLR